MLKRRGALLAGVAIVAIAGPLKADIITFGTDPVDHLNAAGPQTEGDFTYTAFGDAWELQTVFAVDGAALVTFFNDEPSEVGQTVDFELTGGGQFTFESVDFRTILGADSDQVLFSGFLGGALVDTLALDFSSESFMTIASGFASAIDVLTLEVTTTGSNAAIFDNLVLTAVPAPGALATLGLFGLFGSRRRRLA